MLIQKWIIWTGLLTRGLWNFTNPPTSTPSVDSKNLVINFVFQVFWIVYTLCYASRDEKGLDIVVENTGQDVKW